jgi:hypothetical protein
LAQGAKLYVLTVCEVILPLPRHGTEG